ncbi:hypothetical protein WT09_22875 [Burkholderia stagnalis]|uniref:hypothetical protein n=1 Tax=Burkholderia stagnalis TaxID=1503054 RepID=UPI0007561C30|nr:hypothetical protein [Burkholderia stagnalis]KVN11337.1 hypothetical protein WT09_22875 [Burkholderia stagnalis]
MYQEGVNEERDVFWVRQIDFFYSKIEQRTAERDAVNHELAVAQLAFPRELLELYPEAAQTMGAACVATRDDFAFEGDDLEAVRQVYAVSD